MTIKRISAALAAALLALGTPAQNDVANTFTLDAQLYTRGEYDHGAVRPRSSGENAAVFATERLRLTSGYQRDWLDLKLSAQHTGVWGADGMNARNGRLTLNEAWARLRMGRHLFAQVGRQQLDYDDGRLLGSNDWDVAGNWHNAMRLGYEQQATAAHLILALNQEQENVRNHYYAGPMPYKGMLTLWLHHDLGHEVDDLPLGISLLAMNLACEAGSRGKPQTRHMQTLGTHLTYSRSGLEAAASFYYQTGKDSTDKSVSAFMASVLARYKVNRSVQVRAGYDYLSGNDGRNVNQHAFSPLFGSHHDFYGAMDYFTGRIPLGLQDVHAGISADLLQVTKTKELIFPLAVSADYHYLLCAEKYGNWDKPLGHELDIRLSCQPLKDVTFSAGYSFMRGTASMDLVRGGSHRKWQDWAWVSLNVNPRIFCSKW